MKYSFLFIVSLIFITTCSFAQENVMWLRYPAISPDGAKIAFCYKGKIYVVPSSGGIARPLTMGGDSYERTPVWSHDGKHIAFASDRYGNFDVFVMPAEGGEALRLTYSSEFEIPSCFSNDDKSVIFSAHRQDLVTDMEFPMSMMGELYAVPVSGGHVNQILPTPALRASFNSKGDKLIYQDIKGYENQMRKHHQSSVTRDIWLYNFTDKKYTQLTTFKGEDLEPVFAHNDSDFFYVSEASGSLNIVKSSLFDPTKIETLTHFTKNPVRFLSNSKQNELCFTYDGEIYTLQQGSEPKKVPIEIKEDGLSGIIKTIPVGSGFTEAKLSPNGKEFAFIYRGEVFVSNIEGTIVKRITNTPWQERSVSFSPDGKSLVFAAEKNNHWSIYSLKLKRKEEPYFFASTVLEEDTVVSTPEEAFQPAYSPDGKEIAYLENRDVLKVINLATKKTRTILTADKNYSYADGD